MGGERWGFEGWGFEGWGGPNPEKVGPRRVGVRRGGGPEGWGPEAFCAQKISRFFSLSRRKIRSFLPSLGVFSWNFGGF